MRNRGSWYWAEGLLNCRDPITLGPAHSFHAQASLKLGWVCRGRCVNIGMCYSLVVIKTRRGIVLIVIMIIAKMISVARRKRRIMTTRSPKE